MSVEAGDTRTVDGVVMYAVTTEGMRPQPVGACAACAVRSDPASCTTIFHATGGCRTVRDENLVWVPVDKFVEWRLTCTSATP